MDLLLENYEKLEAHIEHGSIMVPKAKYPLMTFLCGFLYNKINSIEKIFPIIESLFFLSSEGKLNSLYQQQLLFILYQKPQKYEEISSLLERLINNEEVQILVELEKIQTESTNEQEFIKQTQNKMIQMKDQVLPMRDKEQQPIYDEKYFQEQAKLLKQSEQLAKKLQLQEEAEAKKKVPQDEAVCEICYVGLYEEDFLPLQTCEHIFHKNCLAEAFKAQISENKFPLKCADDTCQMEVKDGDIKQVLQAEIYNKYQKHTLKFYADTNGDSTSWCPTADCEYMFFFEKDDDTRFECPQCSKEYCLNCRVQWHKNMSCKQYQITNTTSQDDVKFMNFVKGKKFKQCPKCKFWVQKNQGCDHMTCKCKFQFCYKCGGNYGKCECVLKAQEQMRRRMELAEERRQKKLAKNKKSASKPVPKKRGRK